MATHVNRPLEVRIATKGNWKVLARTFHGALTGRPLLWIFLAVSCLSMLAVSSKPVRDFGYACDPFGYLRSAQNFERGGPSAGFDTRVKLEEPNFLIRTAKSLGIATNDFSQLVGPHGFWYCAATDHVIHQYPPGAGLILSHFHKDRRTQWTVILAMACTVLPFLLIASQSRLRPLELFAFIGMVLASEQLLMDTLGSHSVLLTIGLIPLASFAAARTVSGSLFARWVSGVVFGMLSALLLLTRIPNLFVVSGLCLFLVVLLIFTRSAERRGLVLPVVAGFAVLFLCGVVPLLTFNRINAGSFFASTYSPVDATPPRFDSAMIRQNLDYYLHESFAWRLTVASLLAIGLLIAAAFSKRNQKKRHLLLAATAGVSLTFSISTFYFLTHSIREPYYLAPGCLLTIFLATFAFAHRPSSLRGRDLKHYWRAVAAILLLAICVEFELRHFRPEVVATSIPAEVTRPRSIVWADLTSGTLLYYNNKYAAKLVFGSPCAQNRMVQSVSESGRPQYFIDDAPDMAEIVRRLTPDSDMKPIGTYQAFGSWTVYRLETLKKKLSCPS